MLSCSCAELRWARQKFWPVVPRCAAPAGTYDTAEIEGLLGAKLTSLYEGNASALRVLGAHSECSAPCARAQAATRSCALLRTGLLVSLGSGLLHEQ